ncbi:MAG: glycosyltransferase [Paracoccaceae bacterium]|nr:glycosyltransferase [Paracoccaceae bacterium]
MLILVSIAVLAWLLLLTARGGFWRADQRLGPGVAAPETWPEVVVLIPARNEAETIGPVLESHGFSEYLGALTVVLVDDGSADDTAGIARRVAGFSPRPIRVVSAPALPKGWTGKLWALETGYRVLDRLAPGAELILLTDADIAHKPDTLAGLVEVMLSGGRHLVSLMARLDARGFWGGLLIPAFLFFFQKLYPFAWVNDPARATAGAAGGCIMLRRDVLDRIGGFGAVRGALIDDCALAAAVKAQGGAIWLGLAGDEVTSLRDNRRLGAIWRMVARTAFTQLGHSAAMLGAAVAGMALIYLAGPIAVLGFPWHQNPLAATLGAVAWMLSGLAYLPTLRLYGKPAWQALGLPLAAAFYMAMTISSATAHWRGQGGRWKGRSY